MTLADLEPSTAPDAAPDSWQAAPHVGDGLVRLGLWFAFRLLLVWWFCRKPHHRGALVAVWQGGRVLLVQSSYRAGWTLPGGGVGVGEAAADAACRELREELRLVLAAETLGPPVDYHVVFNHQRDHVSIFSSFDADIRALRPDGREIRRAALFTPAQAARLRLPPFVRTYLAQGCQR